MRPPEPTREGSCARIPHGFPRAAVLLFMSCVPAGSLVPVDILMALTGSVVGTSLAALRQHHQDAGLTDDRFRYRRMGQEPDRGIAEAGSQGPGEIGRRRRDPPLPGRPYEGSQAAGASASGLLSWGAGTSNRVLRR